MMKLFLHAVWLTVFGVGCVVIALFVALFVDRLVYRKGFRNVR